jgi:adenylate kinase
LVIIGAPGAGKGTQAKKLAVDFNWDHISTGDMLRNAVKAGTPLGLKVKDYVHKGNLVPDELMVEMVAERLKENQKGKGFILDGFPRTVPQAEQLDVILEEMGMQLDGIIYIDVPKEEIVNRLSKRFSCASCSRIISENDDMDGKCPYCKGQLVRRKDDDPDTIRHRLDVFERQTSSLIQYYKDRKLLVPVNGMGLIEDIYLRVIKALGISSRE